MMTVPARPRVAAPETDELIPAASVYSRDITRQISTLLYHKQKGQTWVRAQYRDVSLYPSPADAPQYARLTPATPAEAGGGEGMWWGELVVQEYHRTEPAALAALLAVLEREALPYEREKARDILGALTVTTEGTVWEKRPLGLRGPKPRRFRHRFRDENGVIKRVYADTMRRHADPNCQCAECAPTTPQDTPK